MCVECYRELGSPRVFNGLVSRARDAIREVYAWNGVGGGLHVVVDDLNVDDDCVIWCRSHHADNLDQQDDAEQIATQEKCIGLLEKMTVNERATAIALAHGWIDHAAAN